MVWSCSACTFENAKDSASACSICGTRRAANAIVDLTSSKTEQRSNKNELSQLTLFGGAVKPSKDTKKSSKRKRNAYDDSTTGNNSKLTKQPTLIGNRQSISTEPFNVLWEKAQVNMRSIFKVASLRSLQPRVIKGALKRQSQIVVMATGGGKSLCYQLPATVLGGVTLVISPLIALMVDQVQSLNEKGIAAALISSANGKRDNDHVMDRLLGRRRNGNGKKKKNEPPLELISILYVTPELIKTDRFRIVLQELYLNKSLALIAIDEAHCISSYGHDFRVSYRKLDWLRSSFPEVPFMACTATATQRVIQDIREVLLLKEEDAPCHMSSFNRPNISYQVRYKDSLDATNPNGGALGDVSKFVLDAHNDAKAKGVPCAGIVYVHKRDDTTMLANHIAKTTGIHVAAYHAGLKDAERARVQRDWTSGKIQICVATIAFGMGIDLPHVRYVIHWTLPKTVEGFYQESGRSGRDGLPAVSVLYYSKDDVSKFAFVIRKDNNGKTNEKSSELSLHALQQMSDYCMNPSCRRQYLLYHFGEKIDPKASCNQTCDFCKDPKKVITAIQGSQVVKDVMSSASFRRKPGKGRATEWDGQWNNPHGEENDTGDDFEDHWTENDLGITCSGNPEQGDWDEKKPGFVKASSVLSRYEMLECQENQTHDGFVKFKTKMASEPEASSRHQGVVIPEHLRKNLPDPLSHHAKKGSKSSEAKSSSDLSVEADRLKAELAQLEEKRAERLASLKGKTNTNGGPKPPPPPPPLSFGRKKTRR